MAASLEQEAEQAAVRARLGALERQFEKAATARKPLDIEWVLDTAFFNGHQYTEWNSAAGRFQTMNRPANRPNQVRCIDNRIYSLVMDSWAMAKGHDPAVEVAPTNVDSTEIAKARVGQAYLDHVAFPTQSNWKYRRDQALFWAVLCGEGWLKVTLPKGASVPRIEACDPLSIYLQPGCSTYLDARWLIHTRGMDPEDVYNDYGVDLPGSDVDSQDALKTKILREMGMVTGNPTVTVKELWELPSRRHPRGRFVTWTRNRILQSREFPYSHGMLPFAQIGHSPVPGTAHYSSGTKIARPLNMELNSYHNQKLDHRKRFADGKWFIDSTMDLDAEPDDSAGQVMKGDTRGGLLPPPAIIQGQQWADSADGEWIEGSLQNAVGIHEASMGQAPGRVDSAQGIEALQEGDQSRLSEVEGTLLTATSRLFGQILSLAKQYVSAEVILPLYSANAKQFVHAFKTSDFPDKPIVKVTMGGGLPKNKAARRQEIIAMWSAGLLGQDPSKALAMLDFPAEANITGNELEEMVARNENMLLMQGIPVTPKKWQNHELHKKIHNEARNTAEFDSAGNDVWDVFEFHFDATDTAELEEMREEAERQAAIEGTVESVMPPEAPPAAETDPAAPDPALQNPAEMPVEPDPATMGSAPAPMVQPSA